MKKLSDKLRVEVNLRVNLRIGEAAKLKMALDFDLNHSLSTVDEMDDLIDLSLSIGPPGNIQTAGLDLDDDEITILSPRSFAEAREKARRNRRVVQVIDDETVLGRGSSGRLSSKGKQRWGRAKSTTSNNVCCINLEDSEKTKAKNAAISLEKIRILPKEPIFSCPVCMAALAEETSTKCGHIFCKECINKAIAAQSKCPTCRRKLKAKDTFRIYLPTNY